MKTQKLCLPGDKYAKPGTEAWANWIRSAMQNKLATTNFDVRQLVADMRRLCEHAGWRLMTTEEGKGFKTFEQYVVTPSPWGLGFKDFKQYRAIILSEMKNEREFDLLTISKDGRCNNRDGGKLRFGGLATESINIDLKARRSILRAPSLIQRLFIDGLISLKSARLLGPDPSTDDYTSRKAKADRAIAAIQAIQRNGDKPKKYRAKINAAVLKAFGRSKPTALDVAKRAWNGMNKDQRAEFRKWISQ